MDIYVMWEAAQIEGSVASALMADNAAELRHFSQDLERAANDMKQWALASGGSIVLNLISRGCFSIPPERAYEVADARIKFEESANGELLMGLGMTIAEAFTALRAAKLRGNSEVVLYTPDVEEEVINEPPEGLFGKSELAKSIGLQNTVEGFMQGLKATPKGSPVRGQFITQHMNHPPFLAALQAHPQGAQYHKMLTDYLNSAANAGFRSGGGVVAVKSEIEQLESLLKDEEADPEEQAAPSSGGQQGDGSMQSPGDVQAETGQAPTMEMPSGGDTPAPVQQSGKTNIDEAERQKGMAQGDDPKQAIMTALQEVKSNAAAIERLKSINPEAYNAVRDVVQAMIMMAQNMAKSEDEEVEAPIPDEEIEAGTEHEMNEHKTLDRKVAMQLAMDHLKEDRNYYKKLGKDEAMPMPATTPKKFNDQHPIGTQFDPPDTRGSQTAGKIKTQGHDPQTGQPLPPKQSRVLSGRVMGPTGRAVSSREPDQE